MTSPKKANSIPVVLYPKTEFLGKKKAAYRLLPHEAAQQVHPGTHGNKRGNTGIYPFTIMTRDAVYQHYW
jgi:hypothetical protein